MTEQEIRNQARNFVNGVPYEILKQIESAKVGDIIKVGFFTQYKKVEKNLYIKNHPCNGTFTDPYCEKFTEKELVDIFLDAINSKKERKTNIDQ